MAATKITPAQQALIDAITAKVDKTLGTQLPGKFHMMSYPPGFNYAIQYSQPPVYNQKALDTLNSCLMVGDNGMLTLSDEVFSTTYFKILTTAKYQYSENDKKVVQDPNIQSQMGAVALEATTSGYAAQFPEDFPTAPTYMAVIKSVTTNFGGKMSYKSADVQAAAQGLSSAGFASLGQAIASSTNLLAPLLTIQGTQAQTSSELSAALDHAQNPSDSNGGIQTGPTNYYVGWNKLPTNAQVLGGLKGGSSVTISISASNFSSTSTEFSIKGGGGGSIPIADFFSVGISGSASYNMSKYTQSSSSLQMDMNYEGVSFVQAEPEPLSADYKHGWWDESLLRSIVTDSDNQSVSGFKIDSQGQFAVNKTFGPGKPFSRLRTVVVSNYPEIVLTFKAADATSITKDFRQDASVSVKLFGLFTIGSVSESYHVRKVDSTSVAGEVKVTLGPPDITGTVPMNQQVCYVLGGVPIYPPS